MEHDGQAETHAAQIATVQLEIIALKARLAENQYAQSAAAAEEGRRLLLFKRGVELSDAIKVAEDKLKRLEGAIGK